MVTGLVGLWKFRVAVVGEQNRAGTAMMGERRDAGLALVQLVATIDQRFADLKAERTVWTVGSMRFEPGEPSIIPGRAHAILQFRDADLAVLQRLEAALFELADQASRAGPCKVAAANPGAPSATMDARLAAGDRGCGGTSRARPCGPDAVQRRT